MYIKIDGSGLNRLILQMEQAERDLLPAIASAMQDIGNTIAADLTRAAPHGPGTSSPPGDEVGPLDDSFVPEVSQNSGEAKLTVRTTQPTKLTFVRKGTGIYGPKHRRIVPTQAKALWWRGAQHPVKSVSGERPNDFVTPVLRDALPMVRQKLSQAVGRVIRFQR